MIPLSEWTAVKYDEMKAAGIEAPSRNEKLLPRRLPRYVHFLIFLNCTYRNYFKIRHVILDETRLSSSISMSANASLPPPLEQRNLPFALYRFHCSNCSFILFMSDRVLWEPSVNGTVLMRGTGSVRLFCPRRRFPSGPREAS